MPSMTRLDLVTSVGELIGDPNHNQWTEAQKQDKIQEAQEQFVEDTQALTDTQTFSVISGTSTYALSTDTLDIIRVGVNGVKKRRLGKFDIDLLIGGDWSTNTGPTESYYVDYTSTNKNLTLYPIPTDAVAGTNNLVVEYVKVPPEMASDSDQPLNSQVLLQPYLTALSYYASAQLLNASNNPQDWAKADRFIKIYKDKVSDCRETFAALADTVPMRLRGGRYFKGL